MKDLTIFSKTLGMKLIGSSAVMTDGVLSIEFERALDCDWVKDKPRVMASVREAVEKAYGPGTQIAFCVRKRAVSHEEPVAVELPAEGQRLEQLAREVFGA